MYMYHHLKNLQQLQFQKQLNTVMLKAIYFNNGKKVPLHITKKLEDLINYRGDVHIMVKKK